MSKPTSDGSDTIDPATDPRSDYDHRSSNVDEPGLVDNLVRLVEGDVWFDTPNP